MGQHIPATSSDHSTAEPSCALRKRDVAVAVIGPFLILLLWGTYLISPQFYLTWILEAINRERQLVELITTSCSLLAGLILLWVGMKFWRLNRAYRGSAIIILIVGLASVFLAGEESSWGQTYIGWNTPDAYQPLSGETNLHNTDLPIQSLGSAFLLVLFVALPVAWWLAADRLPKDWACAIPEWPVVVTFLIAFLWKEYKSVYRMLYDINDNPSEFYMGFVEQINEQKEMLAAVGLLIYAIYRIARLRRATRIGS